MTHRVFYLRCTECDWHGSRDEHETLNVCPMLGCGGDVEPHGPKSRLVGAPSTSDMGLVRPSTARTPFGIPTSAPRLRPWHDGNRVLPNGLRAKVVRLPSIADALDDACQQRADIAAEIASASGWNHEDV